MSGFVRLNKDRTETITPFMAVRPNPIKFIPDNKINEYGWFKVESNLRQLKSDELHSIIRTGWKLTESIETGEAVVEVDYALEPVDIDTQRSVIAKRCHNHREEVLQQTVEALGHELRVDNFLISELQGNIIAGNEQPISLITEGNETIEVSAANVRKLHEALTKYVRDVVFACRAMKDEILATEAPLDYDYRSGWPSRELVL